MNFVEVCRKLISIDTSPGSSTLEMATFVAKLAEENGLRAEVLEEIQNGIMQANVIIRIDEFKAGDNELLLQAHMDTVDPGSFPLWKKNDSNPFDAVIEEGKIYGLGAAEVKLDLICKLQAMLKFKENKLTKLKPVLVGTFGEETGMQGTLRLIRKNKINARYGLIAEASDMKIVNASKGFAVVEIRIPVSEEEQKYKLVRDTVESTSTQTRVFSGKAAHSSTPHLGDNAIQKMLEFLQKMPENMVLIEADGGTRYNMIPHQAMVELEIASHVQDPVLVKINRVFQVLQEVEADMKSYQDLAFEPHHSTLSVGIIRTFEDSILIGGSCRILPNVTQEQYEAWMKKIQIVCEEFGINFRVVDYKKPFRTNENSILVKTSQNVLEKLQLKTECITLASTNEASLFSRLGMECICIGAGAREGNVHTPEEHVRIADLEKMTEFYEQIIERLCL